MATVLSTEGGTALIDRGLVHGLRVDDRGQAYYSLAVGAASRRIEIGPVRLVTVELSRAEIESAAGGELRPGCRIEFEVDLERLTRTALLAAVRQHLEERPAPPEPGAPPDAVAADPALEELLREALGESGEKPQPSMPGAGMVQVAGGRYAIGLDLDEAGFLNQHPRFEVSLAPYWIERRPRTRLSGAGGEPQESFVVLKSWAEAAEICRQAGLRLPTEIEWEAAAQAGAIETGFPVFEWTASWYQPYPGNELREEHYGRRFRVLRGSVAGTGSDYSERRYMAPEQRNRRVGFRCAGDAP